MNSIITHKSDQPNFYETLVILITFIKETLFMSETLKSIDSNLLKNCASSITNILKTIQAPMVIREARLLSSILFSSIDINTLKIGDELFISAMVKRLGEYLTITDDKSAR